MTANFYALYLISFLCSGIGFLSQTLVSGFWATTFSEDVLTFSLGISSFFLGMGLSSLYAQKIKNPKRMLFVFSYAAALFLGITIPVLKGGIGLGIHNILFPVSIVFCAGILNGFAVPLALRALEGKTELGTLFFLDYLAAILFSFLFTFVFLIPLGYQKTAVLVSSVTAVIILLLGLYVSAIPKRGIAWVCVFSFLASLFQFLPRPKDSSVIYQKQTHYQKIVLTELTDPVFPKQKTHHLYLDGFLQFSGEDEQIYHACLVNIPMSAVSYQNHVSKKVLILGGGDGLAVRNVLQNTVVDQIDLVELDPEMIRMAKEHPMLLRYNSKALLHPKVNIMALDAFNWVRETKLKYDVIIIDFPAPKNLTLARLFSLEFYSKVKGLLNETGFIAIQGGPSYSFSDPKGETLSEITTSIEKTLSALKLHTAAYAASKDSEAFVLAWKNNEFDMDAFAKKVGMYDANGVGSLCTYRKTWKHPLNIAVNTLNTLPISRYMLDWFRLRQGSFFNYRGAHAVFLPE